MKKYISHVSTWLVIGVLIGLLFVPNVIAQQATPDVTTEATQPAATDPPTEIPVIPTEVPVVPTEIPVIPTEIPVVPTQVPVIPTDVPSVVTEIPAIPTAVPTTPASTTAPLQRNSLAPQSQPAKPTTPTPPPATPTITSITANCSGSGTLTVENPVAGATVTLVLTYHIPGEGNTFHQTSNTTTITLVAGRTSYPFTIDTTTGVPSNANTVRVEVQSTSIGVNGETTKSVSFGPCGAAPTNTPTTAPTNTPTTAPTNTPTTAPTNTPTNTVVPSPTATTTPDTGKFKILKRFCQTDNSGNEKSNCNGRDSSADGTTVQFVVHEGGSPSGTVLTTVPVMISQGNGSQGESAFVTLPDGTYTVCETVPAGFTAVPKPDGSNQTGITDPPCIVENLGPNNDVLQFNNFPNVTPTPTETSTVVPTVTSTVVPTVTPVTPTVTPVTPTVTPVTPTATDTVDPTAPPVTPAVTPTTVTFPVKKTPTSAAPAVQALPNTGAGPHNPGSGSSDSIWLMIFAIVTLAGAAITGRTVYARKRR